MKGIHRQIVKDYQPRLISEGFLQEYAVLVPLIRQDDEIFILFERRSQKVSHAGDFCFPGGKIDEGESSLEAAIRETKEELLIHPEQIDVFGQGDSVITTSNLLVHSYIGILYDYQNTFNEYEVDYVEKIALKKLLSTTPERYKINVEIIMPEDFPYEKIEEGKSYDFHRVDRYLLFYEVDGIVIWGLTAQILHSALEILKLAMEPNND